jgi:hypothetical protein
MLKPSVGDVVHYVSYGTPNGEYPSTCRAAIVAAVDQYQPPGPDGKFIGHVSLAVLNPEGMFFNRSVLPHDGAEVPGDPDCPAAGAHGNPMRYCGCGWMESAYRGGTWHSRENCPA